MRDLPADAIARARRAFPVAAPHALVSALKAAQPAIEAQGAAAERARILAGLDAIQVTLTRPGYGNGPAHDKHHQVVLVSQLRDLVNHIEGN